MVVKRRSQASWVMGCVSSKQTVSVTPAIDHSGVFKNNNACSGSGRIVVVEEPSPAVEKKLVSWRSKSGKKSSSKKKSGGSELGTESGRASSTCRSESLSFRLGNLSKYLEAEQVAAGWPSWLSNVAGEAIHGWVPFRSDAFEKLEKVNTFTILCFALFCSVLLCFTLFCSVLLCFFNDLLFFCFW